MKTKLLFCLLLLAICLLPGIINAQKIQIPSDYANIQSGIDAASDGDIVYFGIGLATSF